MRQKKSGMVEYRNDGALGTSGPFREDEDPALLILSRAKLIFLYCKHLLNMGPAQEHRST
jgi:hypothetical protein